MMVQIRIASDMECKDEMKDGWSGAFQVNMGYESFVLKSYRAHRPVDAR